MLASAGSAAAISLSARRESLRAGRRDGDCSCDCEVALCVPEWGVKLLRDAAEDSADTAQSDRPTDRYPRASLCSSACITKQ
jgi:hypothetical protein